MKLNQLPQKCACATLVSSVPGFLDGFTANLIEYKAHSVNIKGEHLPGVHWLVFDPADIPDITALDFPADTITLECTCVDYDIPTTVVFKKEHCFASAVSSGIGATFNFA